MLTHVNGGKHDIALVVGAPVWADVFIEGFFVDVATWVEVYKIDGLLILGEHNIFGLQITVAVSKPV